MLRCLSEILKKLRVRSVVLTQAAGCRNDFLQDVPPSDFLSFYLSGCQTAQFDSLPPLLFWKELLAQRTFDLLSHYVPACFQVQRRGRQNIETCCVASMTCTAALEKTKSYIYLSNSKCSQTHWPALCSLTTTYCTSLLHSQQQCYNYQWIITLYCVWACLPSSSFISMLTCSFPDISLSLLEQLLDSYINVVCVSERKLDSSSIFSATWAKPLPASTSSGLFLLYKWQKWRNFKWTRTATVFVVRLLGKQRESCSQLSPSSVDTDKQRNVTMADKHRSAATQHFLRQPKCVTQCHAHKSVLGQWAAPFTHSASNLSPCLGFQRQT